VYVRVYVSVSMYVRIHICVCMYVCMYLCVMYVYVMNEGGPKNNENFFSEGVRGGTSVCSRLVRVRNCPPHQLAKRRP